MTDKKLSKESFDKNTFKNTPCQKINTASSESTVPDGGQYVSKDEYKTVSNVGKNIQSTHIEDSNSDEIVVYEISSLDSSSQEEDSESISPENLENVSVVYEFPENNLVLESYFDSVLEERDSNIKETKDTTYKIKPSVKEISILSNTNSTQANAQSSSLFYTGNQQAQEYVIQIEDDDDVQLDSKETPESIDSYTEHICSDLSVNNTPSNHQQFGNITTADDQNLCSNIMDSERSIQENKANYELSFSSRENDDSRSSGNSADVEDNAESSGTLSEDSSRICVVDNKSSIDGTNFSHERLETIPEKTHNFYQNPIKSLPQSCPASSSSKPFEVPVYKLEIDNPQNSVVDSNSKADTNAANSLKMRSVVTRNKKRKCQVCKKKLDLTAVVCRCGGLFCSKHRYDSEHDCTFDYKAMGAEKIRKENPQIVAEKVSKL